MPRFDLSRPFLAIQRRASLERGEKDQAELIVNPFSVVIEHVVLKTSGLESGAVGIAPTREIDRIDAGAYAELGFSTLDEFIEMICTWTLEYEADGEQFRTGFISFKGMSNCESVGYIPYVGGAGEIVPLREGPGDLESPLAAARYEAAVLKLPEREREASMDAALRKEYETIYPKRRKRPRRAQS